MAPAVITTSATVTATSKTDPTKTATATVTLTPISVTIRPTSPAAMIGGATQALTATVASDGSNSGVTWTVTGGGSFSAGTTASGIASTYTSASPVTTATAVVTATSIKDPSKSASATIMLTPVAITFSTPTLGITLDSGQTMALTAAVAHHSSASGATFTWAGAGTVSPLSATGNSPATTLTATGTVTSTVSVTATSIKDPTKSGTTASITVNPALAITTIAGVPAGQSAPSIPPRAFFQPVGAPTPRPLRLPPARFPLDSRLVPPRAPSAEPLQVRQASRPLLSR